MKKLSQNYPFTALFKWAGGKQALVDRLSNFFRNDSDTFVEPFVGSGAVFMNFEYPHYILADNNADLINVYKFIKSDHQSLLNELKNIWGDKTLNETEYYKIRKEFNSIHHQSNLKSAVYFLYLNRYGYNGLCRYNSNGEYNVPYGWYKHIMDYSLIEEKINLMHETLQRADVYCQPFQSTFELIRDNYEVYCDPPYAPIKKNTFINYTKLGFDLDEHEKLVNCIQNCVKKHNGVHICVSNHDTDFVREIYKTATKITSFDTKRQIARKSEDRKIVCEIVAEFS